MSRSGARLASVFVLLLTACGGGSNPPAQSQFPPARLAFSSSPTSATAGELLYVVVHVLDERGVLADAPVEVTLATTSGTLGGTATRVSTGGVAIFADVKLTRSGSATLVASAPDLEDAETPPFTVVPGPAASLAFDAQLPTTTTAGDPLPGVKVAAYDAHGNLATNAAATVRIMLAGGGANLSGTIARELVLGVATFADLSVPTAGTGYRLSISAGSLGPAESTAFDIVHAPAERLMFVVEPHDAVAGDILTPAVAVRVQDAFGNLVPEQHDVTISTSNGGLAGTRTVTSVAGVATFADLYVTVAGVVTATATANGLGGAESVQFTISPAAPVSLWFSVEPPLAVVAGATMAEVGVAAEDTFGNPCTNLSGDVVGLSLEGAELLGTTSRGLVSGVAIFPGLSVRKAATGYRLSALGAGAGPVASRAFDVTPGAVHHLAFTTQPPATVPAGALLSPSVAVVTLDAYDNVTPASGGTVSLSSSVSGAALYGTLSRPLAGGTATFPDLSVRKAGVGYRLVATSNPTTGAASDPFDVVAAAPTRLRFLTTLGYIKSGQQIAPPVQVAFTDDWANMATTTGDVTLVLEPSTDDAALEGTTTATASAGVATFTPLTVRGVGLFQLRAKAPGVVDALSYDYLIVDPNWSSIGPDGGDVTAFATDPASSDVAYAATAGCVWKTKNGGLWWARACRGLSLPMQIEALALHPSSSDKLFAATSLGLFRSNDAGATWSVVSSLGASAPYETLSVTIAGSGAIYVGTRADGLWRSDDDAATWTRLTTGLPAPRVTAVAIEPASTEVLYVAGVDATYVGTVYRSIDRGDTWAETALGPAAFPGVKPASVLVDPSFVDSIYVGAQTGIFESSDRGATFTQTYSGADVRELGAHGPSRTRYAAAASTVLRKQDGGPWLPSAAGLPSEPRTLAVAIRSNGTALAGTRYGVYDRTTSATSWSVRTSGVRALNITAVGAGRGSNGTIVYAATFGSGVFRSLDGGGSWQRGSHPAEGQMFYGFAVERANPLRAWLAGASRLYRTVDGGVTWTESTLANATMSTTLDATQDAIVYAGGTSDVYRSANFGGSFRDLNVCGGPMRQLAISKAAPLALWVGGDAGLCKVDLGRVNDIMVPSASQPGTSGLVDAIAIDPDPALAGSTVWASTSHAFHKTADGGATWTTTPGRFNALLAKPGKLFAARLAGALEVSRDGGATFAPVGIGLYHGNVRALAEVPGVADEIYAGTSWGSVFKTTTGGE